MSVPSEDPMPAAPDGVGEVETVPGRRRGLGLLRWGSVLGVLLVGVGPGMAGLVWQMWEGLGVTGLQQPVFWGVYTVNFVFFIGIAHAGTLVSALLRLLGAAWQRPIARIAEATTIIMLVIGAMQLLIHVGRPLRAPLFMLLYGRFESPLVWDLICILAYLYASCLYLYVALIPDLARLRDRATGAVGRVFYGGLALGWQGRPGQRRTLDRVGSFLAVLIVPIAVSVHSVIAFIFALTLQPLWHSTIFAPYFVVGAIYSGIAALLLVLVVARRMLAVEQRITLDPVRQLGRLLLVLALIWAYFTVVEHVTVAYGGLHDEMAALHHRVSGPMAGAFWGMVSLNLVVPVLCLVRLRRAVVVKVTIAALAVLIGMWLERYLILVPTLLEPRLAVPTQPYWPSWVEAAVLVGSLSLFVLGFWGLARMLPLVPLAPLPAGTPRRDDAAVEGWKPPGGGEAAAVRLMQGAIPVAAVVMVGTVVVWLVTRTGAAVAAGDAPATAIGITLVAAPVFLALGGATVALVGGVLRRDDPGLGSTS